MDCQGCSFSIAILEEIFFFVKGEKDVHLAIKPEYQATVIDRVHVLRESKKVKVKCPTCQGNLGCFLPFGPCGTKFYAFALDKVKLDGRIMKKTQKWWSTFKQFHKVETRDSDNFFNVLKTDINTKDVKKENKIFADIVFPSCENLRDFEWITVSLVKKPKLFQKEAFIEALQRNLVCVIKTGAGKTLIASMFLGRMCKLNPNRMGLMIVDRIPLVFQQGDAIQNDTNLRVARVCGENRTAYKIKQLNEGAYDVLVVTAGAFVEMVVKEYIHIDLFCALVIDECHHVCGSHKMVDCLNFFTKKALPKQPRILGLSASLFSAKTVMQAENRLAEYMKNFPNGKVYHSGLEKSSQRVQRVTITLTDIQQSFMKKVVDKVNKYISKICKAINIPVSEMQLREDLLNAYQVKGYLRALEGEYSMEIDGNIKKCLILLESSEICSHLGVPAAWKLLKDNNVFTGIGVEYSNEDSLSNRLQKLKDLLADDRANSKILIFVSTRIVARGLFDYLSNSFPHYNIEKVFGHGGHDGMLWEGEQEDVLNQFRSGSCNLLICTSILEEGLDVSACDLVVSFSGVKSLIQYIQTRGRARKADSEFVVFQTEDEDRKNNSIEEEEDMLDTVLKMNQQFHSHFSEFSRGIMKKIEDEMKPAEGLASSNLSPSPVDVDQQGKEFSFNVYADVIDGIDANRMKKQLLETLEEYEDFRVIRLEIITNNADTVITKLLSPKVITTFLVAAVCRLSISPQKAYINFCQTFDFQIKLEKFTSKIWTRQNNISHQLDAVTTVNACNYGIGSLKSKTSAVISKVFDKEVTVQFTPKKHMELIDKNFIRVIPLASLGKFALISINSHTVQMIVVLKHPPMLYARGSGDIHCDKLRVSIENKQVFGIEELQYYADYPVLFITFDSGKINDIKEITFSQNLFPVYTFDVNMKVDAAVAIDVDSEAVPDLINIFYSIKCLVDSRVICFPTAFIEYVCERFKLDIEDEDMEKEELVDLLQLVIDQVCNVALRRHYFLDIHVMFDNVYEEYADFPVDKRNVFQMPVPKEYFLVKRVVVTPSRIVALTAVPVASSRLLRKVKQTEEHEKYEAIIVSFRDEDMLRLRELTTYDRVRAILLKGIDIDGVKYRFLLSSGSQLRDHKAYFISAESYEQVVKIRSTIIPNSNQFHSAAKYLSRLGQYGTADQFLEKISRDSVCWIDDVKAENGDLTTDGSGKISMQLASKIAEQQGIKVPSAFQVRWSGVKGILVTCPYNDTDFNGKHICFRKSMEKFSNGDEDLCLVGVSKFYELTLNREVITLLSAIKSEYFLINDIILKYQENALAQSVNILIDGGSAREALNNHLPKHIIDTLKNHNFDIIEEKHWFKVLQGIYRLNVLLLKSKSNIPVDKGCTLVGVPDPLGILKEGEVYVQIRRDDNNIEILCDPALIYRNPCLHPGDHRRVNCVNREELSFLYNVIVMPVKNCTYSLSSVCSGGDLDGDKFGIIWDPNLVPSEELIYPPLNYLGLADKVSPSSSQYEAESVLSIIHDMYASFNRNTDEDMTEDVKMDLGSWYTDMWERESNVYEKCVSKGDDSDVATFYMKFMANDSLGKIAHKHLALCDILDEGARDPLAIEMAKSQATAVDYPKTGILPSVPKEAQRRVAERGYPEFMGKQVADTYTSSKILGILYRRCTSICYNFEFSSICDGNELMNINLIVEGNEEYLTEAAEYYRSYAYNMKMLMVKFDLKVEADVVLGKATFGWGAHYQGDKGKAADAIAGTYNAIVDQYRKIFFSNVSDKESQMKKASAWYRIVNDLTIKVKHVEDEKFLSFPWVVYDILCDIMSMANREQPSTINLLIGQSTLKIFWDNSSILNKDIAEKMKVMKAVEGAVNRRAKEQHDLEEGFVINMYGSTSIYVCEHESDVDICIHPKPNSYKCSIIPLDIRGSFQNLCDVDKQIHFLHLLISPAVDSIVCKKTEYFEREHPIIKCTYADSENPISCDISMNEVGIRKTLYIHHLYEMDVCYLPLFWILVRWARITGLVKSMDVSSSVMDTADFYALIITLLDCPSQGVCEIKKLPKKTGLKYLYQPLDKVGSKGIHRLGAMIFKFFQKASNLDGNLHIEWPAQEIPPTLLDKSVLENIAAVAQNSFHILLATRSTANMYSYLLSSSKETRRLQKLLPLSISYAIGKAHQYHAARLTHMTGAIVTIQSSEGKGNLLLKSEGSQMAIDNLRQEIRLLLSTNRALVLGRVATSISRYFMEGSSIVIAKGNRSIKSPCLFKQSFGSFEALNHHALMREVLLPNHDYLETWKEEEFDRLLTHVGKQLEMFPKDNGELMQSLEITSRFGCFYLANRADHMPASQNTITIQELVYSMEKGRHQRKSWRRSEYSEKERMTTESKDSSYEMVTVAPSRLSRFSEDIKKKYNMQKYNKRGIATAFTPGLLELNTHDNSIREHLFTIYREVLNTLKFVSVEPANARRRPFAMKITRNPSKSFEVQVQLDSDMSLIKVEERPLSWVHCTVIAGREQIFKNKIQCHPDIRMQISSTESVKCHSPLYEATLPEVNGKRLLPIDVTEEGKTIVSPLYVKKIQGKQAVNTVRRVERMEMFTNGSTDASIVYGACYYGDNLDVHRPFCELTLYFNADKLRRCIEEYLNVDLLRDFVAEYFETSILFQEELERVITEREDRYDQRT